MIETYLGIFGGNMLAAIITPVAIVVAIIVCIAVLKKQRVSSVHDEETEEPLTEEG